MQALRMMIDGQKASAFELLSVWSSLGKFTALLSSVYVWTKL
jgi:hypothetical protein